MLQRALIRSDETVFLWYGLIILQFYTKRVAKLNIDFINIQINCTKYLTVTPLK